MERSAFLAECLRIFEINGISCSSEQANQLFDLTVHMLVANQTMNLTAITDESTVILRHYVDSLTISSHVREGARLIDIGCGAGFPTLPLAIFRPDVEITALDGTEKRIRYVQETAKMLSLFNVTAVAGRAEEFAHKSGYREQFDVVTARAVAALPTLCELCLGFCRVGGTMIAMKAQTLEEIKGASQCISLCGGELSEVLPCALTQDGVSLEQRTLVLIDKTKNTPQKYPRHFSKISKKPL